MIIEVKKKDNMIYTIDEDKRFINWYNKKINQGYDKILNEDEIKELINQIVFWYEIKYSNNRLDIEHGFTNDFDSLEDISQYLTFDQLRCTLSYSKIKLLDCNYRTTLGNTKQYIDYDLNKINFVCFNIKDLKKNITYQFYANSITGEINDKNIAKLSKYIDTDDINIEELYNTLKSNNNLDIKECEKIINNHKTDVELRNKIIDYISLELMNSPNTNLLYGEIRAKRFKKELSDYYKININDNTIKNYNDSKITKESVVKKTLKRIKKYSY